MSIQALIEKPVGSEITGPESNLDRNLIQRAYEFAKKAHAGQKRVSGDAYLTHLVGVADILDELHMDSVTIAAGLLHDILEDTNVVVMKEYVDMYGLPQPRTKSLIKSFLERVECK